jgi:hypothetical protein
VKKPILFICYEYSGYNSAQTTALVKRPRYLADYFVGKGHHVTVLFASETEFVKEIPQGPGHLRLISCKYDFVPIISPSWLQKARTAILTATVGDFSSLWHSKINGIIESNNISCENVIAFFTPRGPLYTAYRMKDKRDFRLIFDFQDPLDEGFNNIISKKLLNIFYKKIFKRAEYITCVSKYWTDQLAEFHQEAIYIPHAIEDVHLLSDHTQENRFVILYYGSINFDIQNLNELKDFIAAVKLQLPDLRIQMDFAGNEPTFMELRDRLEADIEVNYLGWVNKEQLEVAIANSDVLCLLPWTEEERKGVPSKFYEYCKYKKPILIVGEDSGGFENEFGKEFHQKYITTPWKDIIFENKVDILNHAFIPDDGFIDKLLVETVGRQFEDLLIR